MPLPPSGSRVGIAVVDVDVPGESRTRWIGSVSPADMAAVHRKYAHSSRLSTGLLFHDSDAVGHRLSAWTLPGSRTRLFDVHGRLLADVNNLYERNLSDDEAAALKNTLSELRMGFVQLVQGPPPSAAPATPRPAVHRLPTRSKRTRGREHRAGPRTKGGSAPALPSDPCRPRTRRPIQ